MPYVCIPVGMANIPQGDLLSGLLFVAIQHEIACLLAQGGPMDRDIDEARNVILAEHGDILLYKSPRRGETTKLFAVLARTLAVGAFVPGGIAAFGYRWIAATEEAPIREALLVLGAEGAPVRSL